MIFTETDIFEKILEPLGIKVGDKINIKNDNENPHTIFDDGRMISHKGVFHGLSCLIGFSFEKVQMTKEEIHEELKKMANWKPDWKNPDQKKYEIVMWGMSTHVDCTYSGNIKHANTVYFKTEQEAKDAIKAFSEEEWKTYFEVE